jgi:molybdate transport system regulatory protein
MALKDKKISTNVKVNKKLEAEIRVRAGEGTLSCAEAFDAARHAGITPLEIGKAADVLGVHLSHCQIGLFGYPGKAKAWARPGTGFGPAPDGLEAAIKRKAGREGRVTCSDLWDLAERYGVPRILVGYTTDQLGIRIHGCQLGAF